MGGLKRCLSTTRHQVPQLSFSLPSCFLLKGNYTCQIFPCLMFDKRKADQRSLRAAGLLPGARRMKLTCHSFFFFLIIFKALGHMMPIAGKKIFYSPTSLCWKALAEKESNSSLLLSAQHIFDIIVLVPHCGA